MLGDLIGDIPEGSHASDHKFAIIFAITGLFVFTLFHYFVM